MYCCSEEKYLSKPLWGVSNSLHILCRLVFVYKVGEGIAGPSFMLLSDSKTSTTNIWSIFINTHIYYYLQIYCHTVFWDFLYTKYVYRSLLFLFYFLPFNYTVYFLLLLLFFKILMILIILMIHLIVHY